MNRIARYLLTATGGAFVLYSMIQLFSASIEKDEADKSFMEYFREDYNIYALAVPGNITLAGEKVPVHMIDVKEKLDRELLVNTYWQSNTLLYIKRAHKYFPRIEPILKANGIPEDFKYLPLVESGFTHIVSPKGAAGYWQIMKTTAREYGLEVNDEVDERYNLEKATEMACNYLKQAHEQYGSWALAAASYNMGMRNLSNQLKKQNVQSYYDLHLNSETARYVYRILAVKQILENPDDYGFHYRKEDLWHDVEVNETEVDTTITDLAAWAQEQGYNYHILKEFNPWLRKNSLTNKSGKTYVIRLPKKKYLRLLKTEA